MSDINQKPIKNPISISDWIGVQNQEGGLGDEKRVKLISISGFIPTIFKETINIKQVITILTIAKFITKLKIINNSANDIYISFSKNPENVGESLFDIKKSGSIKIEPGDTNVFFVGSESLYFGLVSITGTNEVKIIQGI
jgi:hypothetical protein